MASTVAAPVDTPASSRILWIDGLRGLAVFLMAIDHVLVVHAPGHWLRFTLTRLSLPLFALLVGYLARAGWRWRHTTVAMAAAASTVAGLQIGIGQPDILWLLLASMLALTQWERAGLDPLWLIVLGLLQAVNLPMDWTGYQPGYVLAWVALGRVANVEALYGRWANGRGLRWLGRHALSFYVLHLAALAMYGALAYRA